MGQSIEPKPYAKLGTRLKQLRQTSKESLAEVSGAVEIDPHLLERIEAGIDRPDEDILELLITHYHLIDSAANNLWELAGYSPLSQSDPVVEEAVAAAKQLIMVMAMDNRSLYSDGASVDMNKHGIQVSFNQSQPNGEPLTVSKIGMSYDQAAELTKMLSVALTYARYGQKVRRLSDGEPK